MDSEEYWKKKYTDSLGTSRMFGGTIIFGVIINIVILSLADNDSCDFPPCDPYLFYLFISMVVGFAIAKIILKIDPPTAD
jgi:hypothetical protein